MIHKREKIFLTIGIIIFLILIVPATFAVSDNSTEKNHITIEKTVKNSLKDKTIASNPNYSDIYFDASSTSTHEDGSASNPYKKFTADKIKDNSNIHIKNGVYDFSGRKDIYNVSILGESRENTIVSTATFNNKANMDIFNITLKNSLINNLLLGERKIYIKLLCSPILYNILCLAIIFIINNLGFPFSHLSFVYKTV